MRSDAREDRACGALLGLAIGDAIGTTVEFRARDSFPPVTDMVGGGPFKLKAGEWTDDTSMALCLAESLITNKGRLDRHDLLTRFTNWYRYGWNSVTGSCFDIGNATRAALEEFERTGVTINNPDDHLQANGSIMRLAPAVICAPSEAEAVALAREQGQTTHAATVPEECCARLGKELWDIIESGSMPSSVRQLATRPRETVVSSGHAPATHDAARWAVATTASFEAAVLAAVNLGDDADTVGAVTGQLAGALYGRSGIPERWLVRLAWRSEIEQLAWQLWALRKLD